MSKYHSIHMTTSDGITHASRKEARRWEQLLLLQRAGEITNLQRQVKFVLIPAQRESDIVGKRGGVSRGELIERECVYIADFVYTEFRTGRFVVEDTKGVKTPLYILKRKLMLWVHHIRISEI